MRKKLAVPLVFAVLLIAVTLRAQLNKESITTISTSLEEGIPVIHLSGGIDRKGYTLFERELGRLEAVYHSIIIKLDCSGGEFSSSMDLGRRLLRSEAVLYCLVKEAAATGLWICASTDRIYFLPDGMAAGVIPAIVASAPDPETVELEKKLQTQINDFVSELADANGHDKELLLAMMNAADEYEVDGRVWKKRGEMLSLSAKEAAEVGFSEGTVVDVAMLAQIIGKTEN